MQDDVKKLVAYSSVSHLGFVRARHPGPEPAGHAGGALPDAVHGLTTGGLFLGVGVLYERRHTRRLADFGGLWKQMPVFAALLPDHRARLGRPARPVGFVGEFLMLLGTFIADKTWAADGMAGFFPMPKLLGALAATG